MFAYCLNNPVMLSDPTGEIAVATLILIGSAVIGAVAAGYTAYVEYNAGCDTVQIIGDSICAGFSAFSIAYTGGMSLYQCYQNFCYLNALTPVTDITVTGIHTTPSTPMAEPQVTHTSGLGSPKKNPNPNGSYTQFDSQGNIYSYAQYDSRGNQTLRIDFQGAPHAGELPHIHLYNYLVNGGRKEFVYDLNWNQIG